MSLEELVKPSQTASLLADDLRSAHRDASARNPVLALHLEDCILQAEKLRQHIDRVRFAFQQEAND